MHKQKTDGVEMTLMIIHFSASQEDILITVCLSNYNTVCNVSLSGKQAHGKNKLHVIAAQQRRQCGVMILIPSARLDWRSLKYVMLYGKSIKHRPNKKGYCTVLRRKYLSWKVFRCYYMKEISIFAFRQQSVYS